MKSHRRHRSLSRLFCDCIKHVRKTVTARTKESAAIGICVRSVLHTRGKTVKKFRCKKRPYLETQDRRDR